MYPGYVAAEGKYRPANLIKRLPITARRCLPITTMRSDMAQKKLVTVMASTWVAFGRVLKKREPLRAA